MAIKIIAQNKKARHLYQILESFEAGLVLRGSEVKSLRQGHVSLVESFVSFKKNELFLEKCHIPEFKNSSYNNHTPERRRKLLMHKAEISKIQSKIQEKGLSCVPLKIYFSRGKIKLEIGLGKGKNLFDKRHSLKEKDMKRNLRDAY